MRRAFRNAEIFEAEVRAVGEGTTSLALMEAAGRKLADFVIKKMEELRVDDVLFVCGPGKNGGDGFCAAEFVRAAEKDVAVLSLFDRLAPECRQMRDRFGGEIFGRIPRRRYRLIVDCLLGTGAHGEASGTILTLISYLNESGAFVVSCDLPSGLCEGGVAYGPCVKADATLSIGAEKQALLLSDGADMAGKITTAEIGISPNGGAEIWEDGDVLPYFPVRKSHVHKGNFGSAAIVAAVCRYPNAPFFSAQSCLKSGVGYTKLVADEPLFSSAIGKTDAMVQRPGELSELLGENAVALGMGSKRDGKLYEEILYLASEYRGTLILDADALNVCAEYGLDFLKQKKCSVILTPHIGEFSRLIHRSPTEILSDSVALASSFAGEYDVTLMLKNNRTLITNGTRCAINRTGCAALAKGGSGDLLSGFLAGTCARGIPAFEASCVSAFLLGRAGELAAAQIGEYAVTPSDVVSRIPEAIRRLCGSARNADDDGREQ